MIERDIVIDLFATFTLALNLPLDTHTLTHTCFLFVSTLKTTMYNLKTDTTSNRICQIDFLKIKNPPPGGVK